MLANEVQISCLPKDLPDFLEVDIADVELGTTLHLSDLKLPAGVTLVELTHGEDHDQAILSVTKAKVRGGDAEDRLVMVLAVGLLDQTPQRLQRVMAPKLFGAWQL